MNPNVLILGAAATGLIVNTLAIIAVAWRGGRLLGRMEGTLQQLTDSVNALATEVKDIAASHAEVKERLASLETTRDGDRRKGGR